MIVTTRDSRSRVRRLPAHWPLTALLVGFPVWWLLGLAEIVPILLAVPMLRQLLRERRVHLPEGFGLWAMFLVWVLLGAMVLWADAPGAVPGGGGGRLVVFGYRAGWYTACTIVLLWVGNMSATTLAFRRVASLFALMFVFTAAGGVLGLLAPDFELTSLTELALPRSLSSNGFVNTLVHVETADVQAVLGRDEARPKAPFAYANSWGSNLSVYLPFFLVAWWRHGRPWQRALTPMVLAVAAYPVVYSLNRGLWFTLALAVGVGLALQLRRGRPPVAIASVLLLVAAAGALAVSPLGDLLTERMENQHSNDRRGQLLQETVRSAAVGSPVVGFGSTRDVQGSFASIAGAATPDCPACAVPPLGTQGQLWLVVFAQGLVGAALFLAFLLVRARAAWRCRTEAQVLCTFVLLFFLLQLPVYDSLGMPFLTVMVALALVWREQMAGGVGQERTLARGCRTLRAGAPVVALLTVAGAGVGAAVTRMEPPEFAARSSILLAPSPVSLAADALGSGRRVRETTVDTEAALALGDSSMQAVVKAPDAQLAADLRDRTTITAAPNTRVLHLTVRSTDRARAGREVTALASSYLTTRKKYLEQRRHQTLHLLGDKRSRLTSAPPVPALGTATAASASRREALRTIDIAARTILLSPTSAGEVIAAPEPMPLRPQREVPVASGIALGMATGLVIAVYAPTRLRRRTT